MEEFVKKFDQIISGVATAVITSHISPDDDSIGSTLALYGYMNKRYPKLDLKILYTGKHVDRYDNFVNFNQIKFVGDIADEFSSDLLIVLDGGQYSRVTRKPDVLKTKARRSICIDHHSSPPDDFDLKYIDSDASSVSDIIFRLFLQTETDTKILECVLLGILGDTGTFQYINHKQTYIYDIVKKIQELCQIEIPTFKAKYELKERIVVDVITEFLANTQYHHVNDWPDFTLTYVAREVFDKYKCDENDISEASHWYMSEFMRMVKGYTWGIICFPKKDGKYGFSLRSLPGSVSVRNLVERMGKGGGHDRAAGGTFDPVGGNPVTHEEVINYLLDWLTKNANI